MNNKSFFGLVALTVVLQLSVSLSAHAERCKHPCQRAEDRGTSGLLQQTLPLDSQRSALERQAASGPMGEKPEVKAERATDCLVLMTPHRQAKLGLQALLVQQYKEAG